MDSDHEAVESSASDTSCSEELAIGDTSSDGSETSNEDNRLAMKLIERVCKKRLVARSKIPRHASILTGAIHMKEILENPDGTVCRQLFRISQSTFISVCRALRVRGELEDENVSVEEAFGMFAWTVGHKATGHFLPHSTDTVDQHVKRVARALSKMSKDVIRPRHIEGVHPYVQGNPKYYPWFQNCIGAVEGTYVNCWVGKELQDVHICPKNLLAMNVLCFVDFDGLFTSVYLCCDGGKGPRPIHNSRVFFDAINRPEFKFPMPHEGYYYLVDSGLPCTEGFLPPHERVRYHLRSGDPSGLERKELFNYRHSSLRNIAQRTVSHLKNKFTILNNMPQYSLRTQQVNFIMACCVLHNYIRMCNDPDAWYPDYTDHVGDVDGGSVRNERGGMAPSLFSAGANAMRTTRDQITDLMWANK